MAGSTSRIPPTGPCDAILVTVAPPPRGQVTLPAWGRGVVVLARVIVLALCVALAVSSGQAPELTVPLLALTGLAIVMSLPLPPAWARIAPIAEAALAAAVVGSTPGLPDALLLYLVVPPLAAGLLDGFVPALLASGMTAIALVGSRALSGALGTGNDRSAVIQWVGLGLLVGLVAAWGRWSTLRAVGSGDEYRQASKLLTELRDLARTLPTGFDEVGIAAGLLGDLRRAAGAEQGVVLTLTDSGRLAPLSELGADRAMWGAGAPSGQWQQAVEASSAITADGSLDGTAGHTALMPLRLGDRRVGVVAISRRDAAFAAAELSTVATLADDAALRLDTGRLFSDVRAWATVEERQRLSREIHDGIAQELAGVGFLVDNLAHRSNDVETREDLQQVRAELTRIVSELRLSIFDLRSQVGPSIGLGTALGDHVREVGAMAGLTVHLVLDEDVRRLPVESETELLRIAQEAIANARRHAQARNLWVTARVAPPSALVRVEDDGIGMGDARSDSFGIDIMRERAARIGATLTVRPRVGGGTVVEASLGDLAATAPQQLERGSV